VPKTFLRDRIVASHQPVLWISLLAPEGVIYTDVVLNAP